MRREEIMARLEAAVKDQQRVTRDLAEAMEVQRVAAASLDEAVEALRQARDVQ